MTTGTDIYGSSVPLSQLVHEPEFKLHRIQSIDSKGKEIVRAEFDHRVQLRMKRTQFVLTYSRGYMLCVPSDDWRLEEYGCEVRSSLHNTVEERTVKLAYDAGKSEFSVPKEVTIRSRYWVKPEIIDTESEIVQTVTLTSRSPVPETEFYLSHYGLPEPNFSSGIPGALRSKGGTWLWCLVGGGVCLLVGVMFFRWRKTPGLD